MRGVAPSTIVREKIDELLAGRTSPETNFLSALAQLGVRYVVQQGSSRSKTDHLGRSRYERVAGTSGRRPAGSTTSSTPSWALPRSDPRERRPHLGRWTWFCSTKLFGDPHANRTGYRKIARTFDRELQSLLP
jgi:hypothetical protein